MKENGDSRVLPSAADSFAPGAGAGKEGADRGAEEAAGAHDGVQCKAGERKGDERKKFMSACLKGDARERGANQAAAAHDGLQ